MNGEFPKYYELSIIHLWLQGKTRDEIAEESGISQGKVSNIIANWRNRLGKSDADTIREFAKELRLEELTVENCAIGFRTSKTLQKLNIAEAEIEQFLTSIYEFSQKIDMENDNLRDCLIEIARLSHELPISDLPNYMQRKREEKEKLEKKIKDLEEQIQIIERKELAAGEKLSFSLKNANTTLVELDIFLNVKSELEKYGIPIEDINK
jgi:septal ring factor EnvC (AmiA/AmiB activator)